MKIKILYILILGIFLNTNFKFNSDIKNETHEFHFHHASDIQLYEPFLFPRMRKFFWIFSYKKHLEK